MPHTPVSTLNDAYPTSCPHLMALRAEYAEWNWYTESGYIRYSNGNIRTTYEHRLVAMRVHGDIPSSLHVHHVDGCITNNAWSNLEVLSRSEHARLHAYSLKVRSVCPECGAVFELPPSTAAKRVHCSSACRARARYVVNRPGPQRLERLMREVGNWCAIARMYGVSDNAVRKWARRYGLDLTICDGRRKETAR